MTMSPANANPPSPKGKIKNRTIFTRDNLQIMRGMETESVDLIYLDPPFNSDHNYAAPIGSKAAGAEFKDTWTLSDIDLAWWGEIAEKNEPLYTIIDAAGKIGGKSTMSYLVYMSIRILEMHRILRPTGSLYLHCDPTVSHYLKLTLDSVFGKKRIINEIVWAYRGAGTPKDRRAKRHDVIFWYGKEPGRHYFNADPIRREYAEATKERFRHKIGNVRKGINYGDQSLHKLGKHPDDVITDIQPVAPSSKERTGYPTQKPLRLLEDLIESATEEGDMVFDPFCGCATSCLAAERKNRKWVGCDISEMAFRIIKQRLKDDAGLDKFTRGAGEIIHRTDIPVRRVKRSSNIKHTLYGKQEGCCNGCKYHYQFKDLEIDHIVPEKKGGSDDDTNIQLLCGNCNRRKGTGTMAELLALLKSEGMRLGKGPSRH